MTIQNQQYKLEICLKAFEYTFLQKVQNQLNTILVLSKKNTEINTFPLKFHPCFFPIKYKDYTVLRSPHIDKKARDQFEIREHKIILKHKGYWSLKDLYIFLENVKHTKFYGVQLQMKIQFFSVGPKILKKTLG